MCLTPLLVGAQDLFGEGLIFFLKIEGKLFSDELESEHKVLVNSFRSLLVTLDKTKTSCTNKELTDSKAADVRSEAIEMDNGVGNDPTQRKRQSIPPNKSNDDYLILEEKRTCFTMKSDLPSYRHIRLYISINNSLKRMYHCVMEREYILLGVKLNNLPPEYVIPLEKYKISEKIGNIIELVNKNNGLEIAMQFELESECKYWLKSIQNAQASIYTYIPIRLQEKGNNSQTQNMSHLPLIVIVPPALPPKLSDLKNPDVQISGISKSHSSPSFAEYAKLPPKESDFEIESKPDTARLVKKSAFSFPVSSLNEIKSKPLPQIPVAENSPPYIQQHMHEYDVFMQSYDQRMTEKSKFVLSDTHNIKSRVYGSDEVESSFTHKAPEPTKYQHLDLPRKILSKDVPGISLKEKARNMFKLSKENVQTTDNKKSKPRVVYIPNL